MESKGDEELLLPGGYWESRYLDGRILWDDDLDEETVPLLEGPTRQTVRDWVPTDLPGSWNNSYGNPFLFEDWKPLPDPLAEGEKSCNHVPDTCLLLNAPIILSPVLKQPKVEPSQQLRQEEAGRKREGGKCMCTLWFMHGPCELACSSATVDSYNCRNGLCGYGSDCIVFSVTTYRCENWTVKKADQNNYSFEIRCLRSFVDTLDCQKDKQEGPRADKT